VSCNVHLDRDAQKAVKAEELERPSKQYYLTSP
jgi:hypothetical protein